LNFQFPISNLNAQQAMQDSELSSSDSSKFITISSLQFAESKSEAVRAALTKLRYPVEHQNPFFQIGKFVRYPHRDTWYPTKQNFTLHPQDWAEFASGIAQFNKDVKPFLPEIIRIAESGMYIILLTSHYFQALLACYIV
jgi:hypothetical protein